MVRVERNKTAAISVTFYVDGAATAASGAVTVTVTRADGSALVTDAATTTDATGVYTYNLAAQANLDVLTLVYSGTWGGAVQTETQQVEIVGDFYLTEAECRALDASFATSATPLISSDTIKRVRAEVEDAIEADAGVAFVRRFARETLNGRGTTGLLLGHLHPRLVRTVRAYTAAATYTEFTESELDAITYEPSGLLGNWSAVYPYGVRNLVVEYEHGLDYPPPLIRAAARALFKRQMLGTLPTTSSELDNVRSLSVEGYSRTWFEGVRTGSKAADDLIDQWKRSTTSGGVAVA